MSELGFVNFCESSNKVRAADAKAIYYLAVRNVNAGMDLSTFKAALALLVNSGKGERDPTLLVAQASSQPRRSRSESEESVVSASSSTRLQSRRVSRTIRWCPAAFDDDITDSD